MLSITLAVLHPGSSADVIRAAVVPTQPHAIAIYVLVVAAGALVWLGNRGSGGAVDEAVPDATEPDEEAEVSTKAPVSRQRTRGRGSKRLSRAQKKKRGHINWVQ